MEGSAHKFQRFLSEFVRSVEEGEDTLPLSKTVPYRVNKEELEGECIDRVLQYLCQIQCPVPFSLGLAHAVVAECQKSSAIIDLLDAATGQVAEADSLAYHVHSILLDVCRRWMAMSPSDIPMAVTSKSVVSAHAVRNSRRKMEDRHTVIEDLNALYGLETDVEQSFYGVYDGHGGVEAAAYASAHVHTYLARNPTLHSDPAAAMVQALKQTDDSFTEKAKNQGLKSGTTSVCVLIRGDNLYVAWLGDSQALLVKDGNAVPVMNPHKPDRQDESRRIESLGGCVVWFGAWRVNGSLSVSRAIGDCDHKPFISGQADVTTIQLDGTEDYVVLACDGLWDVLTPNDVTQLVYNHVTNSDRVTVAQTLVQEAKDRGSCDNITAVVLFLRETIACPARFRTVVEPYEDELEDFDNEVWADDTAKGSGTDLCDSVHVSAGKDGNECCERAKLDEA